MERSAGLGNPSQWRPIAFEQFTPVNIVACPVADCGKPSTPRHASIGTELPDMRRHNVGQTSEFTGLSADGSRSPTPSINRNTIFTTEYYIINHAKKSVVTWLCMAHRKTSIPHRCVQWLRNSDNASQVFHRILHKSVHQPDRQSHDLDVQAIYHLLHSGDLKDNSH